jgi:hypothetical protein
MPCYFFCYGSVAQFEVGVVMSLALMILLSIALDIYSFWCFQMKFRVDISMSVMNVTGILMGISLNI